MPLKVRNRLVSEWITLACGIWLVALGFYFMFLRPSLLPEDLIYMNTNIAKVRANLPQLETWLDKVFTVMGGFITGSGVLVLYLAVKIMPSRPKLLSITLLLFGTFTFALMSWI